MSDRPETAASQPGRPNPILACAAPAFVFLAIVLPFLRFHEYSLLLPESLILMGSAAALGAALGALSLLRPATLGPALMALTLGAFALYRPEIRKPVIALARSIAETTGNAEIVLGLSCALIFAAIMAICAFLRRHIPAVVTAAFGAFVLGAIALPAPTGGEPQISGALPKDLNDLPPVIHVILDEHIGPAALPADVPESTAAERAIKTTYQDFALYDRAYSQFSETQYSFAALMNGTTGPDAVSDLRLDFATYVLRRNEWFDRLKRQGYAIQVYQSSWLDLCRESSAVDRCYTYPLYSINAVQRSPLSTLARLRVLLGKLHIGRDAALPAPMASLEALNRFRADLERRPRGVAYIVHLLLPHYGYLYREDCSLADPAEWDDQPGRDNPVPAVPSAQRRAAYALYLAQLVCTEAQIAQVLEQLKRLGVYDDATVIVHGDHGSRVAERTVHARPEALTDRDLLDHAATLLAIKAPGVRAGERTAPAALQPVFAETFLDRPQPTDTLGQVWIRDEATHEFVARTIAWPGLADEETGPAATTVSIRPQPQLRPHFE